ncbi:hypothetical protein [Yinghuangia sp. YIM S09857]|uniref:hypothetical protein n=1 Tax=Yinghuangia sp. YIM S09857 TaxID=3436929 RepID=UPI003F52F75E
MTDGHCSQGTAVTEKPVRLAAAESAVRKGRWCRSCTVDDVSLGGYLVAHALVEIRATAEAAMRSSTVDSTDGTEAFDRIRFLANLCDNMPCCDFDVLHIRALAGLTARRCAEADGMPVKSQFARILGLAEGCLATPCRPAHPQRFRRLRFGATGREQAGGQRALAWVWATSSAQARGWILDRVADGGLRWVPPLAVCQ